jgi:hypothetical protein
MFKALKRLFFKLPTLPLTHSKEPRRYYQVRVETSDSGDGFIVTVGFPDSCIIMNRLYDSRKLDLAMRLIPGATFLAVNNRDDREPFWREEYYYTFLADNTRPVVLAILSCDLIWSEEAKQLASVHSISNEEIAAVRESMNTVAEDVIPSGSAVSILINTGGVAFGSTTG